MGLRMIGLILTVALLVLGERPAHAQTSTQFESLRSALNEAASVLGSAQTGSAVVALTSIEVATAPLGTSTGGFTFTFDPRLKIKVRSASSFGPSFGQRSLTAGRHKMSLGANWLHASYDSLAGYDLDGNALRLASNVRTPILPTVSSTALNLDLATNTIAGFAQFGLTESLDVGVIVPWVTVDLAATGNYLSTSGSVERSLAIRETSASGIGDMGVFGKYVLWKAGDGGVAATFDVRLPTGDRDALRGLDITRTGLGLVWSKSGRISPHATAAFEVWSRAIPISADGSVSVRNQVKYAVGVEFDAHPQLTLLLDLVGQQLNGGGQLGYTSYATAAGTLDALTGQQGRLHSVALAPGAKWNVWRNVLLTASALTSLSNNGLRAKLIPVAGLDWSF